MKLNPLLLLQHRKIGKIWLYSVLLSISLSETIVTVMGMLLKEEVSSDYLLTGLVTSFFVASLVVAILSYFLKQLGDSQVQLQTIIELEPECVKLLAADGKVLQMNRAGLEMLEADSLSQLIGHQAQQLVLPEYRADFVALIRHVFEGQSGTLKFEMQGLKGTRRWLETHAVPLRDTEGRIIALLAVTRDMTERKQAEELLQAKTADLLHSNADLEQFAYSVSHDMRQPLRSIAGHLQLLNRSLQYKMDEDDRINLNFALDSAKRMDAMILSLLDYSRIGRKTESKVWLSSRAVLDEALEFLSLAIRDANAEIKISGDWGQIFASQDELSRLLMNLIDNALKYREAHQPACVEINSALTDNTWEVSVCDDGIGINPQQADRLFKFFSRLQSRTRFEGTGMGLALCRRIVEHYGGKIWLESAGEGQGCCFIFELPLNQQFEQQENKNDDI